MALLVWLGSCFAGLLGSLTGLGGGVVVVPLLSLVFGVDIRYAVGASLVSVIATSSGAAATYVKEGISNVRVGMVLEIATTLGALAGAVVAARISPSAVAVVFGVVLLLSALASSREPEERPRLNGESSSLSAWLRLDGSYPTPSGPKTYRVEHLPAGFGVMVVAGGLSGLLGIGSGALKVIAMDRLMRLPFKVSTTTSNFMIGVTAAASAGVYLRRGYIDPGLAMPVVLGVLPAAMLGARVLPRLNSRALRHVFALVVVALALEMFYQGATGRL
jgi:uncharacterized membrane protein YfcA